MRSLGRLPSSHITDPLSTTRLLLRFVLFWLAVFAFQRLLFAIHHWPRVVAEGGTDLWWVFLKGLRLDLSMISFIALFSLPFLVMWQATSGKVQSALGHVLRGTQVLVLVLLALVHCGELNVYAEWNHKLTVRVFTHLADPAEVVRTATTEHYAFFALYFVLQVAFGLWLLRRTMAVPMARLAARPAKWPGLTVQFLGVAAIAVLGARGGWQSIPITISAATFSRSSIVNDLTINSGYFFLQSAAQYGHVELEQFLGHTDPASARKATDRLLCPGASTGERFLTTTRPNIVMVVLESWAAEVISHSGKQQGTTPHFDALIRNGLYFDRFYAASGTSEVGNGALFGGYPALPRISLSMSPEKSRKLPSINQVLKKEGYHASYLFGGDLSYGNLGGYFLDHGFDEVEDESTFPPVNARGKLNIYDTDLLERFKVKIGSTREPFFHVAFTGSTHSPYDIPLEWRDHYTGNEAGILNTIRFADHAIGAFMAACEREPWYANTLFIFVADHGRTTPSNPYITTPAFFHIPLLFVGPVVDERYRGQVNSRIGSQSDLAATLLHQLDLPTNTFPWSRDLMDPHCPEYAMYLSSLGYGWIDREGDFFYEMVLDRYEANTFPEILRDAKLQQCRDYLRSLWEEYKTL